MGQIDLSSLPEAGFLSEHPEVPGTLDICCGDPKLFGDNANKICAYTSVNKGLTRN